MLISKNYNEEAEQAILGGLIMNNDNYYHIQDMINENMFYNVVHSNIYNRIAKLINSNKVADPISITEELGSAKWFKDVGGQKFLELLNDNVARTINIKTYCNIVSESYKRRKCIDLSTSTIQTLAEEKEMTDEAINGLASELLDLVDSSKSNTGFQDLVSESIYEYSLEAFNRKDPITGVKTSIATFDDLTGGLQGGRLYVLAAPSGMGKSAMAMNIAKNVAENYLNDDKGAKIGVFSLEMPKKEVKTRLVSAVSGVSQEIINTGKFDSEKQLDRIRKAEYYVNKMEIKTDDTPSLHINQIRARALNLHRKHGLGLLIVDHIGLAKSSAKEKRLEVADITMGLKNLSKELNIPVIALSQVSREVGRRDNKIPMLSDLKDSASIEQDADMVIFLSRQEYYAEKQIGSDVGSKHYKDNLKTILEHKGLTEFIVAKNRSGKALSFPMVFNAMSNTFIDINDITINASINEKDVESINATIKSKFDGMFKSNEYIKHERVFIRMIKNNSHEVQNVLHDIINIYPELKGVSPLIIGAIASKEGLL